MFDRSSIVAIALAAFLTMIAVDAKAWDETKYPNFGGQWKRPAGIGNQFDQTKPRAESSRWSSRPSIRRSSRRT